MASAVRLTIENDVATLAFAKPDRLNAFDTAMIAEALAALDAVEKEAGVGALIVTGEGRGFCAGADLTGLQPSGAEVDAAMRDVFNPLIARLDALSKPTVAAINGVAAGAGVGVALACDMAVMARSASFVLTFGPMLGLVPDLGCTWFIPRAVGRARAMGMALTGEKISAEAAERWGLVWKVVDDAAVVPEAEAIANGLAAGSPETFVAIRRLVAEAETKTLAEQLDAERIAQAAAIERPAFAAGVLRFLAKKAG